MNKDAKFDDSYKSIFLSVNFWQKGLPRDHLAQGLKDKWHALATEPDLPNLFMHISQLWVPEQASVCNKEAIHLSNVWQDKDHCCGI